MAYQSPEDWNLQTREALISISEAEKFILEPAPALPRDTDELPSSQLADKCWIIETLQFPPRRANRSNSSGVRDDEFNAPRPGSNAQRRSYPSFACSKFVDLANERYGSVPKSQFSTTTDLGGIFQDGKLSKRFAHLREKRRKSAPASHRAGDLNELRQVKEIQRSRSDYQLQDLREPEGGYEVTRDIFSVMGMQK